LRQILRARPGETFYIQVLTPEGKLHFRLRRAVFTQPVEYFNDFSRTNNPDRWPHALLFKGYYVDRRHVAQKAVSADVIGQTLRFTFFGPRRGMAYSVEQRLTSDSHAIVGEPQIRIRPTSLRLVCGLSQARSMPPSSVGTTMLVTPVFYPRRVLWVSGDADYEYYVAYGNAAVAQMEATFNTASTLFAKQLGIVLRPRSFHVFTRSQQPYLSSNAYSLLSEFQSYNIAAHPNAVAQVYHLFSGKLLEDRIIGLSYVGEVCRDNGRYAYSLSQKFLLAVQALITAHELGHSLGAHHPEEELPELPAASLMSGVVQPGNDTFSAFSLGEIGEYVRTEGTCLKVDR